MKIALVGAFDRNNYGDVFMPILFEEQFLSYDLNFSVEFKYYGMKKSDMEYIKGVKTRPLYELYEKKEYFDVIIVVGGEVLTSRYTNMYLNLQTNKIVISFYKILQKLTPHLTELLCKFNLNGNY